MNISRLLFLLVSIIGLHACSAESSPPDTTRVEASSTDEMSERMKIINAVSLAIGSNDFAGLNRMANRYRESRARTPSGSWKSEIFHAAVQYELGGGLNRQTGCASPRGLFARKWLEFDPDQPAAIISAADQLLATGACLRGGAYGSQLSEAERNGYREAAQAAYDLLESNRAMASKDPEYYAVMANAHRALGKSRAELEGLLEEATAREPYYLKTYFKAAINYLPQWGGSAYELDQFARYAAEKTRTSDKTGFYYRVYWFLEDCDCSSPHEAGHWDDMKQAMRDVYERYPVPFNAQHMLEESCKAGDTDEALYYMRALHPEATSDADFALMIAGCKSEAAGGFPS